MQEVLNVGVDVAKAELEIGVVDHPEHNGAIANASVPIKEWLSSLPDNARIAVESTGSYHELLVDLAQAQGFAVYVLNPCDVHYYARGLGQRGKTDRMDAQVISRYIREHYGRLHPFAAGSATQREIRKLLNRRASVVVQRQALLRSLKELEGVDASLLTIQLDDVLKQIDQRIAAQIASDADLADADRRLRTITGVGELGAAWLASLFERLRFSNSDAVVAYSGLDPRPRESGKMRGQRKLSKRGPADLRRLRYMMAVSASRTKTFSPYYLALRARGLSGTAAMVVLARRLLRIAFAVWKTKTTFDPSRYLAQETGAKL